jgi:hypothetical protein
MPDKEIKSCEIWGSDGRDHKANCLHGRDAVWFGVYLPN